MTLAFSGNKSLQYVLSTGIYGVAAIISLTFFIFEYNKRRTIKRDPNLRKLNTTITNRSLEFHSLFALFCCPMVPILMVIAAIPSSFTCSWPIYASSATFWGFINIFLTFYQISRLKYCFSTKNSSKYGYSNALFLILNTYGILIILVSLFAHFAPKYRVRDATSNGPICNPVYTKYFEPFAGIAWALFLCWDWFVLLLYIIKIVQFQRMRQKIDIVHKKVFFILQKILLLTIIYEITGAFVVSIHSVFNTVSILRAFGSSLNVITSSMIIFLMIEHNNDYYIGIIKKLNSFYLCCCCKSLIQDVINHEIQNDSGNKSPCKDEANEKDKEGSTVDDTGDISMDIKNERMAMMMSEVTVTDIESPISNT